MTSRMDRADRMLRTSLAILVGSGLVCASACFEPKQDKLKLEGGMSPDPTGTIEGSVLYLGPRPRCIYEDGEPKEVRGRVVLTLFEYDNPPPPEGKATSALNLMFVDGKNLFTLDDCTAEGDEPDPSDTITRSVPFSWSQIKLTADEASYQIRGYYDADEDMIPFFSVTNLPTAGDVVGAALVDAVDPSQGLVELSMPAIADAANGFVREDVIVTLGNYVWLERPVAELSANARFLPSDRTITVRQTQTGQIDIQATLNELWLQTCGESNKDDCGLQLQQLDEAEVSDTFAVADVKLNFDPEVYAFASEPVDILSVQLGERDLPRPDGVPDPHPLLGSNLGVPWFTPIVIMTRTAPTPQMAATEQRAGLPAVRLIGSVLMDDTSGPVKRMTRDAIDIAVPNVAAVELDPRDPACRLPYLAPGNLTQAFEARLTYCSELPTGLYGVSALQGIAGGARVEESDPDVSDTGYVINGGGPSGQAWTLPNELALSDQVGEGNTLEGQGRGGIFVVYDPKPDQTGDCTKAPDLQDPEVPLRPRKVNYRGLCEDGEERVIENPEGQIGAGMDGQGCLPESCCEGIKHLCGLELCPLCDDETCPGLNLDGRDIRQGPTSIVATSDTGKSIPNCVPFEMPSLCCD